MRTARVHIGLLDGIHDGPSRCYQLDPPLVEPQTGVDIEYITVIIQGGYKKQQLPELLVFAANPINGGAMSMKRLPGSQPLYFWPDDYEHGWHLALLSLGVTEVES